MGQHIRRLRLGCIHNVRDLGGYGTEHGGITRWNTIYRAGNLSQADAADWSILQEAGIKTILDLRSSSEVSSQPDQAPEDIQWFHMPLQTEQIDVDNLSESAKQAFEKSLKEGYLVMAGQNATMLAAALKKLTDCLNQGAVLFHCSAGKDRTGVLASVILYLCGVDPEDIVADYQVSYTYNQKGLNQLVKHMPGYEQISLF